MGKVTGTDPRPRRGEPLSELVAPRAEWYEFAPLEGATSTDVPGLMVHVEAPTGERHDWRLPAARVVQPRRPLAELITGPSSVLVDEISGAAVPKLVPSHAS